MRLAHRPVGCRVPGAGCRLGLNAMLGALRLRPTKLSDLDFVAAVEAVLQVVHRVITRPGSRPTRLTAVRSL